MAGPAAAGGDGRALPPKLKFPRRDKEFKTILAIDGGGFRGIIPAALLGGLEEAIRQVAVDRGLQGTPEGGGEAVAPTSIDAFTIDVADYIDLAAGTSTGSIIAAFIATRGRVAEKALVGTDAFKAALVEAAAVKRAITPDTDIVDATRPGSASAAQAIFLSQADTIFPPANAMEKVADMWGMVVHGGKYSATGIDGVLQTALSTGNMTGVLGDVSFLCTSYNIDYSRPMVFYYSSPSASGEEGESGYATLRRSLAAGEDAMAAADSQDARWRFVAAQPSEGGAAAATPGLSDIVRIPDPELKLWQAVRASTAAPGFFPAALVDNPSYDPDSKTGDQLKQFLMTDGGVVASNPAEAAVAFASSKWQTSLVGRRARKDSPAGPSPPAGSDAPQPPAPPGLAVLSLGCGCSTAYKQVRQKAGGLSWLGGPLMSILMAGGGELSAALNQQGARDAGAGPFQWLRIQLSANWADTDTVKEHKTETLTYMGDVVTEGGPRWAPLQTALSLVKDDEVGARKGDQKGFKPQTVNKLLEELDGVEHGAALLGVGYAVSQDAQVKARLQEWVKLYVLPENGGGSPS